MPFVLVFRVLVLSQLLAEQSHIIRLWTGIILILHMGIAATWFYVRRTQRIEELKQHFPVINYSKISNVLKALEFTLLSVFFVIYDTRNSDSISQQLPHSKISTRIILIARYPFTWKRMDVLLMLIFLENILMFFITSDHIVKRLYMMFVATNPVLIYGIIIYSHACSFNSEHRCSMQNELRDVGILREYFKQRQN